MTDRPAAIVAQVVDCQNDRQHKGFIKITVHVPVEDGRDIMAALGWPTYTTPTPVAIAVLDINNLKGASDVEIAETSPSPSQTPPAGGINKRTQLAGIMSKDPMFKRYIMDVTTGGPSVFDPAEFIRSHCGVKSRKDILPDTPAAFRFDALYDQYRLWRDAPELQES